MMTGRITRFRRSRWLDQLYSLPDPCDTLEAWQRLHHQDVPSMALDELDDERLRLRLRLALERNPDSWFFDRQRRLDQARARCGRR